MAGRLERMRVAAMGLALAGGLAAGCLTELPRGRSCGDGWWDPEYEQCDPTSSDRSYMGACREQGLDKDATCDPTTCEIRASEQECSHCGDGVASGDEACDGDDLRGLTCPSGADALRCTDECELDFELCPAVCGDGIVDETEECDPGLSCFDDDCGPNRVCYPPLGQCLPDGGFGPNLDCSHYATTANGFDKPYASGEIHFCSETCYFGRNECSFCGDGEVDEDYWDIVHPGGTHVGGFPAEICDGAEARVDALEAHCEPRCVPDDEPLDADVVVLCAFECNDDCDGFEQPVNPGDSDALCCLAKDSPCPTMDSPGVPDLPCCSWAEHPEWSCVQGELKPVCP